MSPDAEAQSTEAQLIEGRATRAVCRPNISGAGRRRRTRIGYLTVMVTLLLLGVFLAAGVSWYWRALICLPAAMAAVCFLQVSRNTCIARAAEGTFEHEDLSRTKAPDDEVVASRRVAALIGLACGVLAALTALV